MGSVAEPAEMMPATLCEFHGSYLDASTTFSNAREFAQLLRQRRDLCTIQRRPIDR